MARPRIFKDDSRKTRQNITTVSLLDTWEIKVNLMREGGNFSRFVRNCLREWARYEQEIVCIRATTDRELLCFPRDARLCRECWPDGPPPQWDWMNYMGHTNEGDGMVRHNQATTHRNDTEWIQAQALEYSGKMADDWSVEGLPWRGRPPKAKKARVKLGLLASIKRLLYPPT